MPNETSLRSKFTARRATKTPPHVSVSVLRAAAGLQIDDVIRNIAQAFPDEDPPTRGAISAIENGYRGASAQMLAKLAVGYGIPADALTTDYQPRGALS